MSVLTPENIYLFSPPNFIQILLEAGAKPDEKNNLGRSARDMALAFDKLLVVQHFKNY
jgi:hypothetical protein